MRQESRPRGERQSWKTTAHASLSTQSVVSRRVSAGKSRLKQQILNVKSITERWCYFVDFLHDFESFYFPKRFIYLRGIAFSGPYRWNFRKARDFVYFIDPLLCIVASRASFSRHGLLFRYEAVVFRRYVLALLSVGLLRKFEAYPVYPSLIRSKNPRRFSFFQKFRHFTYMLLWFHLVIPSFPARIDDMRSRFSALSGRAQFSEHAQSNRFVFSANQIC